MANEKDAGNIELADDLTPLISRELVSSSLDPELGVIVEKTLERFHALGLDMNDSDVISHAFDLAAETRNHLNPKAKIRENELFIRAFLMHNSIEIPKDYPYKERYIVKFLAEVIDMEHIPVEEDKILDFLIDKLAKFILNQSPDLKIQHSYGKEILFMLLRVAIEISEKLQNPVPASLSSLNTEFGVIDPERSAHDLDWQCLKAGILDKCLKPRGEIKDIDTISDIIDDIEQFYVAYLETNECVINLTPQQIKDDLSRLFGKLCGALSREGHISPGSLRLIVDEHFSVLPLNIGNILPEKFDLSPPPEILAAVAGDLTRSTPYMNPLGEERFRSLIAERENLVIQLYGGPEEVLDDHDVYLGEGATDLAEDIMDALISEKEEDLERPKGNIVTFSPIYSLYSGYMKKKGAELRSTPIYQGKDGWIFDVDAIEELIDTNTKAILINSPNNPTGAVMDKESLRKILEIGKKLNIPVISDETYQNITYPSVEREDSLEKKFTPASPIAHEIGAPAIILNSYSKQDGEVPGLRLGCAIKVDSANKMDELWKKGIANLKVKRGCPVVPTQAAIGPVEKAKIFYLRRKLISDEGEIPSAKGNRVLERLDENMKKLDERRKTAVKAFDIPGLTEVVKPEGAMYIMVKFPGLKTERLQKKFLLDMIDQARIHAIPASDFEYPDLEYIRFTILPTPEVIKEAGQRLETFARPWLRENAYIQT